jgi:hypothetical protein
MTAAQFFAKERVLSLAMCGVGPMSSGSPGSSGPGAIFADRAGKDPALLTIAGRRDLGQSAGGRVAVAARLAASSPGAVTCWRPLRNLLDAPLIDLACTSVVHGGPAVAVGVGSGCRAGRVEPCRSSNQVTVRPPRRHPHRVGRPATS